MEGDDYRSEDNESKAAVVKERITGSEEVMGANIERGGSREREAD